MRQELLCITVEIFEDENSTPLIFSEKILIPSSIIRLFADFLLQRTEDEYFTISGYNVSFADCEVNVEDSPIAVTAFQTLSRYIPLSTRNICQDIARYTQLHNKKWKDDHEYKSFMSWYEIQKKT